MRIDEAFFQVLKLWSNAILVVVCVLIPVFLIYYPSRWYFPFLVILIIITVVTVLTIFSNLLYFLTGSGTISQFVRQLQQLKVRMKFLLFCFSFEGEYENKKFEINIFPLIEEMEHGFVVIWHFYDYFPFSLVIEKKDFFKSLFIKVGLLQRKEIELDGQKYYLKTDNPQKIAFLLQKKEVQADLKWFTSAYGKIKRKIEISHKRIKLSEKYEPFDGSMASLLRNYLKPENVIATLEKLKYFNKEF